MYTSDRYNSRILEEYAVKKLEKVFGTRQVRTRERLREQLESRSEVSVAAELAPADPAPPLEEHPVHRGV